MSRSVTDPRLAFHVTHADEASGLTKEFLCMFFHEDRTVQLIDAKSGKPYLSRTPCPNLQKEQFFLGSRIVVFGRVLHLVRYADRVTENLCEKLGEATLCCVAESSFQDLGDILDIAVRECSFGVCSLETLLLAKKDRSHAAMQHLPDRFIGQRVALIQLIRDGGIAKGLTLPQRCPTPGDVWVAGSREEMDTVAALYDIVPVRSAADFSCPTAVVLVKPDIVHARRGGEVVKALLADAKRKFHVQLDVRAARQLTFSTGEADRFMNAYKGVVRDYRATVEYLAAGALWAVQVAAGPGCPPDMDVVAIVRELCGPYDSVLAKVLRPGTLRARFGQDSVRNAVHCSDLPDDGDVDADAVWDRPLAAA